MKVSELLAFLSDCDPEAHVIPGHGRMSHYVPALSKTRESRALMRSKGPLTKFLESPKSGETKVVIIE